MLLCPVSPGHFYWLEPEHAFHSLQPYDTGRIALTFLQGSFDYAGWNFLNYVTEENLPRAIFISIPLVTFVYVFANIAYVTAMSPQELMASMFLFIRVNGSLFTSQPLFFAGAREGHLPHLLAMIHVNRCTPIPALLFTVMYINYVGFINYLFYGVTVAGQIVLRTRTRPTSVSSAWPVILLIFWAFLLIFSLYSEPVVCGISLAIMLSGVPLYLFGVYWENKPKSFNSFVAKLTHFGQKLFMLVYPSEGREDGNEDKEEAG
uniref:Solute carrier family 7 member 8b n=1 Tax=Cyprinus carpio TaxID=7962 RepID=A0A8C1TP13_CYPCA